VEEDGRPRPRATSDAGLRPVTDEGGRADGVRIRLSGKEGPTVDVTGLAGKDLEGLAGLRAEQWPALFAVYVERSGGKDREQRPLLGSYRVEAGVVRFEPRFPLAPGVRYRAVFNPARLPGRAGAADKPVEGVLSVPRPKSEPAVVTHVYPSTDRLPENQLKFYIHFSAPMSRGEAYEHVRLLDAAGKAVERPFLELDQELWDGAGRRFTLFFHPGRIKRGLKPREELGPALEEGKRYTLVIDRAWEDAQGNPLRETYRKAFSVGAPDDTPPDPKTWKLRPPAGGTRQPLVVTFPKPMDHALLERLVWVVDGQGRRVAGAAGVTEEEKRWQFTPKGAWPAGAYHLVADKQLEDLAGNNIGRPFEVDVFRPVQREVKAETARVPFVVRAASPGP
jgi:hypothetical protein